MLLILIAPDVSAQKYERRIDRKFEVNSGAKVQVDSKFGSVRVTGSENNKVQLNVLIRVKDEDQDDARQIAEAVGVDIQGSRNEVRLVTHMAGDNRGHGDRSVEIGIVVAVPRDARVYVQNKFGSIMIKSVSGEVRSNNQFGSVEVTNCSNVTLDNSFGNTVLGAISGSMRVSGKNGSIRAYDVPAGSVKNAFGAIDISNARGPLDVSAKMGEVKIRGCLGGVVRNEYGRVIVTLARSFGGAVSLETAFGDIDSDLPLDIQKHGTKVSGRGHIGSGNGTLTVVNKFGEISLARK
jgi:formylmethanofuran dehydrogenase subunit D